MGAVYEAQDAMLNRRVAVKVMTASFAASAEYRERFFNEARAVASLAQANIVPLFDMGTEDDAPYLVMEFVDGQSLADILKTRGALSTKEVCTLGIQIGNALVTAHAKNIIHRDLKPANVLSGSSGEWKLADFGIARMEGSSLTEVGDYLGTPAYSAPEALEQSEFGPASDVYGLGATLFEALTGQKPFGSGTRLQMALRITQDDAPRASDLVPALPASLSDCLSRTMGKDPQTRTSLSQLIEELALVGSEFSEEHMSMPPARPDAAVLQPPPEFVQATQTPSRAKWFLVVAAAAAGLLALALTSNGEDESTTPSQTTSDTIAAAQSAVPKAVEPAEAEAEAEAEATGVATTKAAPAPARDDQNLEEPEDSLDAKLIRRLQKGSSSSTTRELTKLRTAHPSSAYLQGRKLFARNWWQDGFAAYRDAIRLNPAYQSHPPIVHDALRALSSKSQSWRARDFLIRDIGANARPFVQRYVDDTKNPALRKRAERILDELP